MEQLIVLGAGTMAQEVSDLIADVGGYEIVAYAVNQGWQPGQTLNNKPVLNINDLYEWVDRAKAIRAIFWPKCYEFIRIVEAMGFEFATVIHPSASVSKTAVICPGTVISRLVAISYNSVIGKHCQVNRGCTIGHHVKVDDGATLGPGANIAGNVWIGQQALVGMGANILPNTIIPAGAKIRAGSLNG